MEVASTIFTCIAILLSICIAFFLVLILKIYTGKSIGNPKYAPVVGNVFQQFFYFKRLFDQQTEVAKKYPTFRLLETDHSLIRTADSRNVEYVLKTNFNKYTRSQSDREVMMELFGNGIFAVDGENWKQQRKLAMAEFSTRILRDYSSIIFKKIAVKLVRKVSEFSLANQSFDMQVKSSNFEIMYKSVTELINESTLYLQELMTRGSTDSIFKVGFGIDVNAVDGSRSGDIQNFCKSFDKANELTYWRYIDPLWKVKRFLNIGSEALLKTKIKLIRGYIDEVIRTRREQLETKADSSDKEDILTRFLIESKKDPEKMTNEYLRDIILNFMLAGKDSAANTLSWLILMLCKNPLIQEKVVEEIRCNMKDNENVEDFVESITEQVLEKMHYLHAAFSETLRLYPPVPIDGRCVITDDVLPDGHHVKKGDVVSYMSYAMARMPYLWGNDADVYRPERWLKDGIFQQESPYKFISFHGGPRMCIGKDFAYREMKIFAIPLLYFFRFKLTDETKKRTYKTMFTLFLDEGLQVHAIQRNKGPAEA